MKIFAIIAIIVLAVILLGKGFVFAYEEVTPQELKEKMAKGSQDLIILDVREADEVANSAAFLKASISPWRRLTEGQRNSLRIKR